MADNQMIKPSRYG